MNQELNIGVIGAGAFANFAAKAFLKIPGVQIIAVTDISKDAAMLMANDFKAKVHVNPEDFFQDRNIDLVYIATPPFLHYEQSKKALLSGKHVICEKPAALKVTEVEELQSLAASLKLLYVVNLMQRYNFLYTVIKILIEKKIFGNFLHGFFENYASDENLNKEHWFWNEKKSGGIFIEHGVHFFDMFSGWLGEGKIINSIQLHRNCINAKLTDRVQATVLYNTGIVNFYHGFDQPSILDRQEMRLQFERGDITLYGWIPIKMKLHGLLQKDQLRNLRTTIGDFSVIHHNDPGDQNQKAQGRDTGITFDDHVTIEFGNTSDKKTKYSEMLTAMLQDQWSWIKDREHNRIIDDSNAVQSLRMAEQATQTAQYY